MNVPRMLVNQPVVVMKTARHAHRRQQPRKKRKYVEGMLDREDFNKGRVALAEPYQYQVVVAKKMLPHTHAIKKS